LIYSNDANVDFNKLKLIGNFTAGLFFQKFTSNFGDVREISKYWIRAQEKINENKDLFKESAKDLKGNNIPFFSHGKIGKYKNILKKIISKIKKNFIKK